MTSSTEINEILILKTARIKGRNAVMGHQFFNQDLRIPKPIVSQQYHIQSHMLDFPHLFNLF